MISSQITRPISIASFKKKLQAPSYSKHLYGSGYWKARTDYLNWWTSDAVMNFWANLSPHVGMWREIMMSSGTRTQFGTNQPKPSGLGHLGTPKSLGKKSGYWGCYRHRMSASQDSIFATNIDKEIVQARHKRKDTDCEIPIRPGRQFVTNLPDNVCFVVEGQDHSEIMDAEKEFWFMNFDQSAERWMKDLVAAGEGSGVLDSKLCYCPESGIFRESDLTALNYNNKVQLFYSKDLRLLEKIGRSNKGHVDLRHRFMRAYGPGGEMNSGKICLWVERAVIKGMK
ncbi:heme-containing dehydratase [Penicillium malachiteum]|uniref:Heme-containing dehydratase n=1 Tax=Penicillium malachiteum TaxID=1324776 RepID=A0AAD6HLP3_9EURO|nr:heme-containing dehydratase [Penicillium malachiteum]